MSQDRILALKPACQMPAQESVRSSCPKEPMDEHSPRIPDGDPSPGCGGCGGRALPSIVSASLFKLTAIRPMAEGLPHGNCGAFPSDIHRYDGQTSVEQINLLRRTTATQRAYWSCCPRDAARHAGASHPTTASFLHLYHLLTTTLVLPTT
ncbi:hypothetical protein B0H19DRAFT_1369149 [Mycena capillaripes]|nr:hypothetical protein B0H19DRAFT_1369149 [Mycena capillaripes]